MPFVYINVKEDKLTCILQLSVCECGSWAGEMEATGQRLPLVVKVLAFGRPETWV